MTEKEDDLLWTARSFVYRFLLERKIPPSVEETAAGLGIEVEEAAAVYERLHDRHLFFLMPDRKTIRRRSSGAWA